MYSSSASFFSFSSYLSSLFFLPLFPPLPPPSLSLSLACAPSLPPPHAQATRARPSVHPSVWQIPAWTHWGDWD